MLATWKMPGSPWPERDGELRTLWNSGKPTLQIAREMDMTKSAIIGRAHRLGLAPRPSPIHGAGAPAREALPAPVPLPPLPSQVAAPKPAAPPKVAKAPAPPKAAKAPAPAAPKAAPKPPPPPEPAPDREGCSWLLSDRRDADYWDRCRTGTLRVCGAPRRVKQTERGPVRCAWCAEHAAIGFTRVAYGYANQAELARLAASPPAARGPGKVRAFV